MKVRRHRTGETASGPRAQRDRRGVLVVVVIVAMLVMSMLSLSVVRTGVEQFRNLRRQQDRIQSQWLAQAGLQRALAALQDDATYTGEVWSVSAVDLHASEGAEITIVVEQPQADSPQRIVRVSAEFPATGTFRHRTTRSLTFPATGETNSPRGGSPETSEGGMPDGLPQVPPPPLPEPVEAAP